jgi:hypothetical protein
VLLLLNLLLDLVLSSLLSVVTTRAARGVKREAYNFRSVSGAPQDGGEFWSRGPDLNRGPADYESAALPTELPRR